MHGARFMTIGAPENCLPGVEQDARQWSEATEVQLLGSWDVAVAPLESGPWELGKCAYKVLQCMAAGLPVIASPVGVIPGIIEDGKNGFLAADSAACTAILEQLLSNADLRRQVGRAARETVERDYSINRQLPLLQEILVTSLGDRPTVTKAKTSQSPPHPSRPASQVANSKFARGQVEDFGSITVLPGDL